MKKLSSLTIFFPCYNDEHTIGKLVEEAFELGKKYAFRLEVVVVNDGSRDGSLNVLRKLQKEYDLLRIVNHKKNRGYGGALIAGIKAAKHKYIFYTDGDAQYDLKEFGLLVNKMTDRVDVVTGYIAREETTLRNVGGLAYKWLIRTLFRLPVRDANVAFKLMRKNIIDKINLELESGAMPVELVMKLDEIGAKFKEVKVSHFDRRYGRSQFFRLSRIVKTIMDDWKLFGMRN